MKSIHIYKDYESLADGLANWLVKDISYGISKNSKYSFVLSGGSTPKKLYEILVQKYAKEVSWDKVNFFFGDERYVPFDDDRNNGKMAYHSLLTPLGIEESHIFRMPTSPSPERAAEDYAETLKHYFGGGINKFTFDFTLLGMGDDGHTLSVFPHSILRDNQTDWVKSVFNPNDGLQRITMLPWLVNKSRNIAFLAKGKSKTQTLHKVLYGKEDTELFPSQLIQKEVGDIMWFVDEEAYGI